jgi:hypothetical protein
MTTKATTDYRSVTWEAAAQEAAFEDLSFCMLSDGRFINRHAMPDDIEHRSPFALPDEILDAILKKPHCIFD